MIKRMVEPGGSKYVEDDNKEASQGQRHKELFRQALALRSRGCHAEASIVLARLLSEDAANVDALFLRGASLFSLNRYEEAADTFRRVLADRPQNEPASLGLFHSLWKLGIWREAYQEMRRFLAIADSQEYKRLIDDVDATFTADDEEPMERP
jgi:tetratricopeptide (TPR) repeat protein